MASQEFDSTAIAELEAKVIAVLKDNKDGLTSEGLASHTLNAPSMLRGQVVNNLLAANTIEMLTAQGPTGPSLVLRLRRGTQLDNVSAEEQLVCFLINIQMHKFVINIFSFFQVYSLIEETETKGIWIRDVRVQSGLSDTQLRKVFKVLEQRKLVKAVKAVGTTKKCYILYNLEPDDSLTGGTFYSDQQLDSQFVQTLAQVCVNLLQVS